MEPTAPVAQPHHSSSNLLVIIGVVFFIVLVILFWKVLVFSHPQGSAPPASIPVSNNNPTPPPQFLSKTYNSNYFQKQISVRAPSFLDIPEGLFISADRLNGVVVRTVDSSHFLVESDNQTLQVAVVPQTQFYLSAPSDTPPNGPFSGTKLSGDSLSSIKPLNAITIQFDVLPQAYPSNAFPWDQETSGAYIAKAILLYEK